MQRRLRLRRAADFRRLRETGSSHANRYLVLSVAPNDLSHNRYGIITTRRLGTAVARNRARRRIREAIRHWHPLIAPGYDMVFIARQPAVHCAYPELLNAMQSLLQRAGLLGEDRSQAQ